MPLANIAHDAHMPMFYFDAELLPRPPSRPRRFDVLTAVADGRGRVAVKRRSGAR
jgi:hypothetical protein